MKHEISQEELDMIMETLMFDLIYYIVEFELTSIDQFSDEKMKVYKFLEKNGPKFSKGYYPHVKVKEEINKSY
ncbi:hypothetical protein [Myroides odoratus]|uniref:Uncharacterized protein n=1 Tax=Myroides odoratus TaxID=256 RepID=A0A9Q6Z2P1_MYROD|nr:hypothetical protein [Myroides odoratus]EHQ41485.1 hypothetical protein Myrod_0649 [Myroides odoratus DSM 2801]EKB02722.1 hypothetical protein HMPREF9716_03655 [Myroides odoratus CIP 103059]QQT98912.1 hypothetical protein I6I88_11875 [Myroides odoratus]WQD58903.1 hypothetical protein U0010_07100 [Myroides odoratus]STZ28748.1 Uncharacterised protein [Myroides odoratus]